MALVFLLMMTMAFTLPIDGFIDYVWYNTCLTQGWLEDASGNKSEPGFGLICNFTSQFPDNIAVIIPRIMSLILLVIAVIFFSRKFDIYTGIFFIYINGFQMLGAYRQGTATVLLSISIYYLLNKKFKSFNIYSLFSFLFHYSSLLPILAVWFRKYLTLGISLGMCFGILLIEVILTSPYISFFIPESILYRYINLTNESLPGSSYFALGKVWYVIYYGYFIFITHTFFMNKENLNTYRNLRMLYLAFLPIIVAVPTLTLMDSWAATRVSSLTNAFEIIFFALCATNFQRLLMFIAYFIRTTIASISFFIL
jgi:hypothetical protein